MATSTATIINLVKTMIGAGMLALPFAFRQQGILLALTTLFVCGLTTQVGLMLLSYSSGFLPPGKASFFEVAKITTPSLTVLFDAAIGLKCLGVCTSYLVIIGNLMPIISEYFGVHTSSLLWIIVAMIIIAPFSYLRNLESLKTISMVALCSVVYLIVLVVAHLVYQDTLDQRGPVSYVEPKGAFNVLSSIPIMVFAFTCAQNILASINEIENKTSSTLTNVTKTSVFIAGSAYAIVGIAGYLSFGDNVGDNIVAMYSQSIWSTLGRLAIVILVLFSYPLMSHPARSSIINILAAYRSRETTRSYYEESTLGDLEHHEDIKDDNRKENAIVTTFILLLTFVLASTLDSLEMILSFVGATGATTVSFILPGIFGLSLAYNDSPNYLFEPGPQQRKLIKSTSIGLIVWGTIVAVLALGVNFYRLGTMK